MKFSISVRTSIILFFGLASSLNKVQASLTKASDATSDISLVEFQGLLYSEVNGEIKAVQEQVDETVAHSHDRRLHGRFLREEDVSPTAQELWNKVIQHGWDMSQTSSNNYYNGQQTPKKRNLGEIDGVKTFPFLVCSHSSVYKSGFQRMEPMLERTGAHSGDASVVFNDPKKTCFHVSLTHEAALELRDDSTAGEDTYYTIAPMTDLMKIQVETMKEITSGSWTVPKTQSPEDWERLIRVGLSNGHRMSLSEDDVKAMANDILEDIQLLGQAGAVRRRRRLQEGVDSDDSMSLSNMFSVTSSRNDAGTRQLRRNKKAAQTPGRLHNWNRALELGLEADHSCQGMFDTLTVNVHHRNDGFDIVLNPRIRAHNHNDAIEEAKQKNGKTDEINDHSSHDDGIEKKTDEKGIEHSASNHNCVASLIMALSTHPSVKSIETDGHIMTSDFEAQWITQSRSEGKLPLRDLGIDGTNQIISIIDSGLDINHSYFGPTDAGVFDDWDHSQRKVVRYDHSLGDKVEPRGGHGTKVAGAAAAKLYNREANGIAEGAKMHIYDIQIGTGSFVMPSAYTFFESMHSTNKKPARIANGSWNTRYIAYPFSCKFFDEALHSEYQGDLFVASAGNEGLDHKTMTSKHMTIGNPASCKNTVAVGASQSYGDRLTKNDIGMDHLAAFSSRGPTFDGRMKPDVVAPGASVLTTYAHQTGKIVQSYGTSFSGPIVAGNAALVRQYFEEGHLPCTWNNGCNVDPSGSLVKAVLLNGAQDLQAVQVSRPWLHKRVLETVSEYDSNQGMGLIQLDKSLPIPGHNNFSALIRNNKSIDDGDFHDIYIKSTPGTCFNKPYKRDFSATLTWYDPPGETSCGKCLINDLDLMVHWVTSTGVVKYGSKVFPNGSTHKDYVNNVERIRFRMTSSRRYRIRVHAANLASDRQKFSLIATGCFKVIANPAHSST